MSTDDGSTVRWALALSLVGFAIGIVGLFGVALGVRARRQGAGRLANVAIGMGATAFVVNLAGYALFFLR